MVPLKFCSLSADIISSRHTMSYHLTIPLSGWSLLVRRTLNKWCGSGSVGFWTSRIDIILYGSGSGCGSFHQQEKKEKIKKKLDFYNFVTFSGFLSTKTDVNVPSKRKKQKKSCEHTSACGSWRLRRPALYSPKAFLIPATSLSNHNLTSIRRSQLLD